LPTAAPYDSVDRLYRDHNNWLQGWLRKKLGCTSNAADLAQDTFIRILTALDKTREAELDLHEPRAYLTTVATRVLSNHYRRQSLEQAWVEALRLMPEAVAPAPEQQLIILQALNDIDRLLNALPQKVRAVFLAAQLDGMTYSEISQHMTIPPRSVRRYMALAYERCLLPHR